MINSLFYFFLFPFWVIYWTFVFFKNFFYDIKLNRKKSVDCQIISVGNLSFGGTGKTPTVISIVKHLKNKGKSVAVLSRGYGRKTKNTFLVSDGLKIEANWEFCGDEPYLLANSLSNVPVVVDNNRHRGSLFIIQNFNPDVIILDDGFQHRKLHRDIDILLIDCSAKKESFQLFPYGKLREPIKEIKRADILLFSKSNLGKINIKSKFYKNKHSYKTNLIPTNFLLDKSNKKIKTISFRNKNCVLVSGIGNPNNFYKTALSLNLSIVEHIAFKDHQFYGKKEWLRIEKAFIKNQGEYILTTEKDMLKICALYQNNNYKDSLYKIYSLPISIDIEQKALNKILQLLD